MAAFEFSYPELELGAYGVYVKIMQHLLYVRGEFGAETLAALKRSQTAAGLDADGICGIKTWSYLLTGR